MSAPGAYHVPLIVVEQYGGLYEVFQGGAHLVEREVRFEARAQMSPQGAPDPECGTAPSQDFPRFCLSFSSPWQPQPPRPTGVYAATLFAISRWPCTGLLMIGGSVAGWSRRLRVSFGVESQDPPYPPNCVFLWQKRKIRNLSPIYPPLQIPLFFIFHFLIFDD